MVTPSDPQISLSDVALKLTGYSKFRKTRSHGRRELLQLLQCRKITATFDFPSQNRPKIDIPAEFWKDTRSGVFNFQLTTKSQEDKYGQFLVRASDFVQQYVDWFRVTYLNLTDEVRTDALNELASALHGVKTKREAYILESEWSRFVDTELAGSEVDDEGDGETRGKKPLDSWYTIFTCLGLEVQDTRQRGRHLDDERSVIASRAVERAKLLLPDTRIPKTDTVVKKAQSIFDKLAKIP